MEGRIPVIAGIIVDATRDAIRRGMRVRDWSVAVHKLGTCGAAGLLSRDLVG
nr:hypothetical protein [Bradyrhizobium iriomotense]